MSERKKIAAIVTEYRIPAHADVIVGKFIKGFPMDEGLLAPKVDIASLYLDQIPENDIGLQVAEEHGIPIYNSIVKALCLGGDELAVDGVISIGEHGDYADNEKGQRMWPRRYFFEQIAGVIATSNRAVPVFTDKHLSYNWQDAKWMYDRASKLGIPFMAGSSIPLIWRDPWLEHELDAPIDEAIVLGRGSLEGYGFHSLEALQEMVERRRGAETGIAAVQYLEGDAVWKAGDEGLWSRELAKAAAETGDTLEDVEGDMEANCPDPVAFLLEYNDGFKGVVLRLNSYVREWIYAARVDGQVQVTSLNSWGQPYPIFSYLGLNIQEMFLTGVPQYPVERTLLVTGALEALMESRYRGSVRVETPHLNVRYKAPDKRPIRPTAPRPEGASKVPFD